MNLKAFILKIGVHTLKVCNDGQKKRLWFSGIQYMNLRVTSSEYVWLSLDCLKTINILQT